MEQDAATKIRTFICIALPDAVTDYLAALQDKLKRFGGVRWVAPENIHLTLKFLGDVAPDKIDAITSSLRTACADIVPFTLSLTGTGAFPNFHRPRVFWVGVEEEGGMLLRLYHRVEEELGRQFAEQERPFSPHLTLGRSKFDHGLQEVSAALQQEKCPPLNFVARELIAMQSELLPQGALYTPLAIVPFKM
ncbi:RNA 2',3'-cyclic phosphodiesterase [candidate division KSB1 bacterium]|nr:RNA 2',3'-cyclic phosphodiesterase [candidate division KSB1 bacterium]